MPRPPWGSSGSAARVVGRAHHPAGQRRPHGRGGDGVLPSVQGGRWRRATRGPREVAEVVATEVPEGEPSLQGRHLSWDVGQPLRSVGRQPVVSISEIDARFGGREVMDVVDSPDPVPGDGEQPSTSPPPLQVAPDAVQRYNGAGSTQDVRVERDDARRRERPVLCGDQTAAAHGDRAVSRQPGHLAHLGTAIASSRRRHAGPGRSGGGQVRRRPARASAASRVASSGRGRRPLLLLLRDREIDARR